MDVKKTSESQDFADIRHDREKKIFGYLKSDRKNERTVVVNKHLLPRGFHDFTKTRCLDTTKAGNFSGEMFKILKLFCSSNFMAI